MILCCGEALIDMIPTATVSGAHGFVPHSGGAVFNTAVALGRLDAQAGMVTGLSRDMFGGQLMAALRASNVETDRIILCNRPTTLAFVQLVDGHATYDFYDENSAGRMLQPDDMPNALNDVDALYFGGISLACEPCADAYAEFLSRCGGGRVVMMDPNIRPGFIQDETRYRTRLDAMMRKVDIVKVSDEDLEWLVPGPQSLEGKVASLQARGVSLVILTMGAQGARGFLAGKGDIAVPVRKVAVVDTVGAGDTFNAGVLASLQRSGRLTEDGFAALDLTDVERALAFGAQVAGITVSRAGANPPWAHELD